VSTAFAVRWMRSEVIVLDFLPIGRRRRDVHNASTQRARISSRLLHCSSGRHPMRHSY